MKSVLIRLENYQEQASQSEQEVLDCILANADVAAESSVHELARLCYCSASTIVRLCRKIGFEGYREMRRELQCELAVRRKADESKMKYLDTPGNLEDVNQRITYYNISTLEESMHLIEPEVLAQCAELLEKCDTLLLFGIGSSYLVAQDAYLEMLRIGKNCTCCSDIHSQYMMASHATAADAAIIVSYSGDTEEMIRCARDLQARDTPVIAVTRYHHSPLEKMATYCLYVSDREQQSASGVMASRIAQLNAMDILLTAYREQTEKSARESGPEQKPEPEPQA